MKKTLLIIIAIAVSTFVSAQYVNFSQNIGGKVLYFHSGTTSSDNTYMWIIPDASYLSFTGTLTIPETVTYGGVTYTIRIYDEAFMGCTGLTTVDIDGGSTGDYYISSNEMYIGQNAFKNCTGITTLKLKSCGLDGGVFDGCTGLQSIYCYSFPYLNYGEINFAGVSSIIPIHVPQGYTWWQQYDSYFTNYIDDLDSNGNIITQYTITANSNNDAWGTVSGGGPYNSGATATLTATPTSGYRFVRWNDNNTQNPRYVTVTGNATYTAYFDSLYTITVNSNNDAWGTAYGGGTYNDNETAILIASPNFGYRFVQWQDGITENPRYVTVTGNATYTAYFESQNAPTDQVDTATCIISSFPYTTSFENGFICWHSIDNNQDGITWQRYVNGHNSSYSVGIHYAANADDFLISPYITTAGNYTIRWVARAHDASYPESYILYAIGVNDVTLIFQETISSTNYVDRQATFNVAAGDTVAIAFRYISNDMYYLFIDNIVINLNTTGIDNIDAENGSLIHSVGNRIVVESAEGQPVRIYDMMGRKIECWQGSAASQSSALPNGVYLVQVGDNPARKVVVMN